MLRSASNVRAHFQLPQRFVGSMLFGLLALVTLAAVPTSGWAQDRAIRPQLQKEEDPPDVRLGIQNQIASGGAIDSGGTFRPVPKFKFGQFYVWAYKIKCVDETNPELGNDDDIQTFWQVDADEKRVVSATDGVQRQLSDGVTRYYTTLAGLFLPNKQQQLIDHPELRLMLAGGDKPLYVGQNLTIRIRLIEVDDVEPGEVASVAEEFGDQANKIPVVGQFAKAIAEVVEAIANAIPGTVKFPEKQLSFSYAELQQLIPLGGEKEFRMPTFQAGGGEYAVFIKIGRGKP
jgi:hypothetical protein